MTKKIDDWTKEERATVGGVVIGCVAGFIIGASLMCVIVGLAYSAMQNAGL